MTVDLVSKIRSEYIDARIEQLDPDFLSFEEDMAAQADLQLVLDGLAAGMSLPNPHNSCILFATGLSNDFDFIKARADTIDGSPPDCILN